MEVVKKFDGFFVDEIEAAQEKLNISLFMHKYFSDEIKKGKLDGGAMQRWIGVRGPKLNYYNIEG